MSIFEKNAMIIERTNNEVIIRLPGDIDIEDLQDLTDWLRYKEIARKAKVTQKDADLLVKQVKNGRWARTKAGLLK
jgi:hypothetical protein